jgi:uracil-DNA glycosylase family 4
LPDSAFLLVESGGEKDADGKTSPRALRHFPVRDASGEVDAAHVRNAIARIPQSEVQGLSREDKSKLQDKARALLSTTKSVACKSDACKGAGLSITLPPEALPSYAPAGARVMFVGAAPTALDIARGEPLSGPSGAAFRTEYLEPLGLLKTEVAITHLVPVQREFGEPDELDVTRWRRWMDAEIYRVKPSVVVALGQIAKAALGERAHFSMPHPSSVRKGDTRGEVARKVKAIRKRLTEVEGAATHTGEPIATDPISGTSDAASVVTVTKGGETANAKTVSISKADKAKQVVYGVVLDPYTVDTQNDWTPPAQIEQAAHRWLAESRVIGLNHEGKAAAYPVESFMVPYPSSDDYAKAMRNEAHKALHITLGDQQVGSGAWVLGVKVPDAELWKQVEAGDLDAFSIGGFSERLPTTRDAMPTVEF